MRETISKKLAPMFIDRWSTRAFSSEPIDDDEMLALFEAARWSPSCFNEQPWCFAYARKKADLEIFRSVLTDTNQVWAKSAPILVFVFSKRYFDHNGNPNRWAVFDTGAAWMALAMQAHQLGLQTHAMGGFDAEKALILAGLDEDEYEAVCAVAIGKPGDKNDLPDELQQREIPSSRRRLDEIMFEGVVQDDNNI